MKKEEDLLQEEEIVTPAESEAQAEEVIEDVIAEENEELIILQNENAKLKEEYLRAFADAENTKRRCLQEIDKNNKYAISSFAKALLPVADNLQRAIQATETGKSTDCDSLLKGVELTQAELTKAFAKFNVKKMETLGTIFDPNFHQAIQELEDKEKPAGTVVVELQTGYMINDRILREAMVVVTK